MSNNSAGHRQITIRKTKTYKKESPFCCRRIKLIKCKPNGASFMKIMKTPKTNTTKQIFVPQAPVKSIFSSKVCHVCEINHENSLKHKQNLSWNPVKYHGSPWPTKHDKQLRENCLRQPSRTPRDRLLVSGPESRTCARRRPPNDRHVSKELDELNEMNVRCYVCTFKSERYNNLPTHRDERVDHHVYLPTYFLFPFLLYLLST